jgi:hypothetical protein
MASILYNRLSIASYLSAQAPTWSSIFWFTRDAVGLVAMIIPY